MKTGLTQPQRKARTRRSLVETARRVFLERGFHGASLDDIADAAGYSKGAVYSNFASKADLFLAVLDAHFEERARAYADVALDGRTLEDSYRAVARFRFAADEREPEWEPLLLEFWTYAARRKDLRSAVVVRRERFLDLIAGLIAELASRHGVAYPIPAREVARGSAALLRGMAIERMLDPSAASLDALEQVHGAYMKGLTKR
jgi:AcrR family transcriptional regulator